MHLDDAERPTYKQVVDHPTSCGTVTVEIVRDDLGRTTDAITVRADPMVLIGSHLLRTLAAGTAAYDKAAMMPRTEVHGEPGPGAVFELHGRPPVIYLVREPFTPPGTEGPAKHEDGTYAAYVAELGCWACWDFNRDQVTAVYQVRAENAGSPIGACIRCCAEWRRNGQITEARQIVPLQPPNQEEPMALMPGGTETEMDPDPYHPTQAPLRQSMITGAANPYTGPSNEVGAGTGTDLDAAAPKNQAPPFAARA
jgi:hypothetical protein